MNPQEQRKQMVRIAEEIADGKPITNFSCPYCGEKTLAFSFTIIKKLNMYGLFLGCKNCGNGEHVTFSSRPKGFTEELVLEEYQRLEDEANQTLPKKKI